MNMVYILVVLLGVHHDARMNVHVYSSPEACQAAGQQIRNPNAKWQCDPTGMD